MATVFIVNSGIRAQGKSGLLNAEMTRFAQAAFEGAGHTVLTTDLNDEWVLEEELDKVLAADLILVQTPIWAMSTPWHYTKWQDIVLTHPKVCGTDGRTRTDPDRKYGSGGFLTDKFYWLSTTWNAPKKALDEPGEFFDARGIEEVLMPLHKQFAYMGIRPFMPTFAVHDVYKNPTIASDLNRWQETLKAAVEKLAAHAPAKS
ncbi:MAG: NAD(P)H-dependent oxidoreductase [Sutterellaceae bacterium]|nr:NAD(P)H-dependent oxidoreductase [Sutterellaceae bacterium]